MDPLPLPPPRRPRRAHVVVPLLAFLLASLLIAAPDAPRFVWVATMNNSWRFFEDRKTGEGTIVGAPHVPDQWRDIARRRPERR